MNFMSEPINKNKQLTESYAQKTMPGIISMTESANTTQNPQSNMVSAVSTISWEERNTVRIIELPACKMVTSGPAGGDDIFAPEGVLSRFSEWFSEYDKGRADHFYPRDFMWSPPEGGFQWGYAVDEDPVDTGGFSVIDFPGGLYAAAISVDADGSDHDRVYNRIQAWVRDSGCFVLDETDLRRSLGHITSPPYVKDLMGYEQMDLYFPIAIRSGETNEHA
jgi:AraC family transcriptional regulator